MYGKDKCVDFVRELIGSEKDFVVATVMDTNGSTPRKPGAWMAVAADGRIAGTIGGGRIEAETVKYCMKAHEMKEPISTYHFKLNTADKDSLDMGCGGEADILIEYFPCAKGEIFLEQFRSDTKAYIFGAGHVCLALEPVLRHVGFDTFVVDDRSEYANRERFPLAKEVLVVPNFQRTFDRIESDENSYFVIVTRGHIGDLDVLRQAINQPHKYLGMIGSKNKTALLYDLLRTEGVEEVTLQKIYAPIGERIFAETPEEIAISITGEMIRVRAGHGKNE